MNVICHFHGTEYFLPEKWTVSEVVNKAYCAKGTVKLSLAL